MNTTEQTAASKYALESCETALRNICILIERGEIVWADGLRGRKPLSCLAEIDREIATQARAAIESYESDRGEPTPEPTCPICGKLAWAGDTDDDNQHPECVDAEVQA